MGRGDEGGLTLETGTGKRGKRDREYQAERQIEEAGGACLLLGGDIAHVHRDQVVRILSRPFVLPEHWQEHVLILSGPQGVQCRCLNANNPNNALGKHLLVSMLVSAEHDSIGECGLSPHLCSRMSFYHELPKNFF